MWPPLSQLRRDFSLPGGPCPTTWLCPPFLCPDSPHCILHSILSDCPGCFPHPPTVAHTAPLPLVCAVSSTPSCPSCPLNLLTYLLTTSSASPTLPPWLAISRSSTPHPNRPHCILYTSSQMPTQNHLSLCPLCWCLLLRRTATGAQSHLLPTSVFFPEPW